MSAFEVCGTARAASFRKSCREQTGVGDYQGAFVLGVTNFEFYGAIRPAGDPIEAPSGLMVLELEFLIAVLSTAACLAALKPS